MKIALISFSRNGFALNRKLTEELGRQGDEAAGYAEPKYLEAEPENAGCVQPLRSGAAEWTAHFFAAADALIFIGAAGIAVRLIAPYVRDKYRDPAVICTDEKGRFCISLLSGHIGGANELAQRLAEITGGTAVITTASDLSGKFAVDVWAKKNGLTIMDRELAGEISSSIVNGYQVGLYSDFPLAGKFPPELVHGIPSPLSVWITDRSEPADDTEAVFFTAGRDHILRLVPKSLCLGIGCRKDADPQHVAEQCLDFLQRHRIDPAAIGVVASINLKKDEPAVLALAARLQASFRTFTAEELRKVEGDFSESGFVTEITGVGNVCGRASLLVYPEEAVPKEICGGVTFALSRKNVVFRTGEWKTE